MNEEPRPAHDDLLPLVTAARAGDAGAFAALVERTHRLVYKIALHKCRDTTDADDLTQEVYLHVYRSLPSLRDPQAFLGWLMALVHNRGNRFCRQRQARVIALEEARAARARERERPTHDELGISEIVATLPEEFRLALVWKYLDGCSYDEIGQRLSMSFHQVDYLLRRAKQALRMALEPDAARQANGTVDPRGLGSTGEARRTTRAAKDRRSP